MFDVCRFKENSDFRRSGFVALICKSITKDVRGLVLKFLVYSGILSFDGRTMIFNRFVELCVQKR